LLVAGFFFVVVFVFVVIAEHDQVVEIFVVGAACGAAVWGSSGLGLGGSLQHIAGGRGDRGSSGLVVVVVEEHFATDIIRELSHVQEWVGPAAGTVFGLTSC
jgi:hypothetical protein